MPRTIRAPRGTQLTCKNWLIEFPAQTAVTVMGCATARD